MDNKTTALIAVSGLAAVGVTIAVVQTKRAITAQGKQVAANATTVRLLKLLKKSVPFIVDPETLIEITAAVSMETEFLKITQANKMH